MKSCCTLGFCHRWDQEQQRVLPPGVHLMSNNLQNDAVYPSCSLSFQRMLSRGRTSLQTSEIIIAEEVGQEKRAQVSANQALPLSYHCLWLCHLHPVTPYVR